jgi:hypothetical protein
MAPNIIWFRKKNNSKAILVKALGKEVFCEK